LHDKTKEGDETMKKRATIAVFGLFFAFTVFITQCGIAQAETSTLKAVTAWVKTLPEYKGFTTFTDLVDQAVAKRYPGELKLQHVGGPEAIKTPDQVEALQRGMVDIVYTSSAYYTNVLPEVDSLKLTTYHPSEERANGAWAYLNELHEKRLGVHYLARNGLDMKFHLYLKKPIKSADLKGLNIRVSPLYLQVIRGLGGNPVVIPPTEVYAALERNIVDGYCWPVIGIRDLGLQKLTRYVVDPGFYNVPNLLLVNLKVWNNLPQKLRDVLTEAAIESEKRVVAMFEDLAKQERPILLKEGIQVIDLPPAEKEKFLRVAYDEGWKDVLKKNPETGPKLKELLTRWK
jgi:TRAP-type C4-dicarboxylate transport system substrate-binding protein